MGALGVFVRVLDAADVELVSVVLTALEQVLRKGKGQQCRLLLEELGGVPKVEKLEEVRNKGGAWSWSRATSRGASLMLRLMRARRCAWGPCDACRDALAFRAWQHKNEKVYEKAVKVIELLIAGGANENLAPPNAGEQLAGGAAHSGARGGGVLCCPVERARMPCACTLRRRIQYDSWLSLSCLCVHRCPVSLGRAASSARDSKACEVRQGPRSATF